MTHHLEPNGVRLAYALSGLGKSWLCAQYPDLVCDTDAALDAALATTWRDGTVPERRRRWRALAQTRPWHRPDGDDFACWHRTRRTLFEGISALLEAPGPRLVLTNLLDIPWPYWRYFGVERGRYTSHWATLVRSADNGQSEADNARLEGYAPCVRLPVGTFLAQHTDITAFVETHRQHPS